MYIAKPNLPSLAVNFGLTNELSVTVALVVVSHCCPTMAMTVKEKSLGRNAWKHGKLQNVPKIIRIVLVVL